MSATKTARRSVAMTAQMRARLQHLPEKETRDVTEAELIQAAIRSAAQGVGTVQRYDPTGARSRDGDACQERTGTDYTVCQSGPDAADAPDSVNHDGA